VNEIEQACSPNIIRHVQDGLVCCDPVWEAAYKRFETEAEEIQKFRRRLKRFGLDRIDKQSRVVELFCGRGGGLTALEQLGFQHVEGVDLSESLLQQYQGKATLHLADCRQLPFADASFDVAIVQGGLHHLPQLPTDLEAVLREVRRVLRPEVGTFYVVEPWQTPFLRFAHFVTSQKIVRRFYAKGDALAVMTQREQVTYEQWLSQPKMILRSFAEQFDERSQQITYGKLMYSGTPKGMGIHTSVAALPQEG